MIASSYREITAVFDRLYASPRDQPMPIANAFAELAANAERTVQPERADQSPEPDW